jgi:hypothetical protein
MAPRSSRWVKIFEEFIGDLRITSKEVVSTDERGVKIELWESQRRFLHEIGTGLDNGIHIFKCLKGRQQGITTISLALADVFWLAMHPGMIGCLVTDDEKKLEANRALITQYIESFPDGYFGERFEITASNRKMMKFSNNARLDLLIAGVRRRANTGWAEGVGYAMAHLTEVANYGDVEGLRSLEEAFAQDNPHRLYIYESTAKGFNHWKRTWEDGKKNHLTERSFFIGWWAGDTNRIARSDPRFLQFGKLPPDVKERATIQQVQERYNHKITQEQLAWLRWKQSKAGAEQDQLDQDQPSVEEEAFVMTGYSFFETRTVAKDIRRLDEEGVSFRGYRYEFGADVFSFRMHELSSERGDTIDEVELRVWEEPVEDARYSIGFDPAFGRNEHKDHHAIVVFRCFADRMVQVAEFCTADIEVKHAAWVCFHLCGAYRNCLVNVELMGPGRLVMQEFDHVRQILSADMYQREVAEMKWQDALANASWFLYRREDSFGSNYQYNYESSYRTKMMMLHKLRGAYVSREIEVRSKPLLREMGNVVVVDGDIGAPESRDEDMKDDRVFAAGLANLNWQNWIRKEMIGLGETYDVVMSRESKDVSPTAHRVNSLVLNFMRTLEEQAREREENPPRGPQFMIDQGLL